MLDCDTAIIGRSIWKGVDRALFGRIAVELQDRAVGPRDYSKPYNRPGSSNSPFKFEAERRLADDFAFVMAYTEEAKKVSAATVECDTSSRNLLIRLAANEGIDSKAGAAMDKVISVLRIYAKRGQSLCTWRTSLQL